MVAQVVIPIGILALGAIGFVPNARRRALSAALLGQLGILAVLALIAGLLDQ